MVPNNLDNPHAVAQVLNQEKGKLKMKYLRDGKFVVLLPTVPKFNHNADLSRPGS